VLVLCILLSETRLECLFSANERQLLLFSFRNSLRSVTCRVYQHSSFPSGRLDLIFPRRPNSHHGTRFSYLLPFLNRSLGLLGCYLSADPLDVHDILLYWKIIVFEIFFFIYIFDVWELILWVQLTNTLNLLLILAPVHHLIHWVIEIIALLWVIFLLKCSCGLSTWRVLFRGRIEFGDAVYIGVHFTQTLSHGGIGDETFHGAWAVSPGQAVGVEQVSV
jgi:hypothetical protein